jgi:hypothetical protein
VERFVDPEIELADRADLQGVILPMITISHRHRRHTGWERGVAHRETRRSVLLATVKEERTGRCSKRDAGKPWPGWQPMAIVHHCR